ncbi:hypothetical protein [Brevibacterium spongiae]|uniref:Uncharacterized protein n=1 Tax=Brevibacterium spongiae TaxID=2909672 RepID=A0ABY5SQC4_9MICO|nr:hypothetical protein [Brevibacterium spongiae]UVI36350.1 hypothetical protein L1F31_01385 [Brevibacterium spongiae]
MTEFVEGAVADPGTTSETAAAGNAKSESSSPSSTGAAGDEAGGGENNPNSAEASGPQPGTAEPAENPSAEAIEGCDESTCSVSDAVTYEHLYQGPVTVVLFADFSKEAYGVCKVAVLSSDGGTAQIFPLEYTSAWSMTGGDLTDILYFLDPATDATKNIFFRMPGMDGWSASGLRPVSTGLFELVDLDYIGDDFSDIFNSQPMTSLSWGELDENGNYELEIENATARWDGQKYSAP